MSAGGKDEAEGGWSPLVTQDGSLTLVHDGHGEACHSRSGAWLEAWERYVLACRVPSILERGEASGLRLLDVGTGLGWNVAALVVARDRHAPRTPLEVVTLEIDPRVIRAAIALSAFGPDDPPLSALREVHRALERALARRDGGWVPLGSGADRLRLVLGDGRRSLPALEEGQRFDLVFLDPFSPKSDPSLWEPGFLGEIARRMAPGSWLSTYSAASRVRAGLVAAGLRVGPGPRVARKAEGTVASPDQEPPPFPPRVARRIARQAAELRGEPRPDGPESGGVSPRGAGEWKNPPGGCSTRPGVGLE